MKEIYVYNCPYVKQVAEETIWDFSTSEIYRFSMGGMASKSTRQRLAGTYRVITADNTAMSIELREDKALVVHTDKGPCEGTWSIGLGASKRYLTYTKDIIVCSININCQLIRQRYRCVFERDGVMILIPMKNIKRYWIVGHAMTKETTIIAAAYSLSENRKGETVHKRWNSLPLM